MSRRPHRCGVLLGSLVALLAGALPITAGESEPAEARRRIVVMEPLPLASDLAAETAPSRIVPLEPLPASADEESAASRVTAIEERIREWASVWSEQRIEDYFACYSNDFRAAAGVTLAQWKIRRIRHLSEPTFIQVSLAALEVRPVDADTAHAEFVQAYSSNTYGDVVTKRLELAREDDGWKIVAETVVATQRPPVFVAGRTSTASPGL